MAQHWCRRPMLLFRLAVTLLGPRCLPWNVRGDYAPHLHHPLNRLQPRSAIRGCHTLAMRIGSSTVLGEGGPSGSGARIGKNGRWLTLPAMHTAWSASVCMKPWGRTLLATCRSIRTKYLSPLLRITAQITAPCLSSSVRRTTSHPCSSSLQNARRFRLWSQWILCLVTSATF